MGIINLRALKGCKQYHRAIPFLPLSKRTWHTGYIFSSYFWQSHNNAVATSHRFHLLHYHLFTKKTHHMMVIYIVSKQGTIFTLHLLTQHQKSRSSQQFMQQESSILLKIVSMYKIHSLQWPMLSVGIENASQKQISIQI